MSTVGGVFWSSETGADEVVCCTADGELSLRRLLPVMFFVVLLKGRE